MSTQHLEDNFSKVFAAPEFITPYLHFFAAETEMRLVVLLGKESLTAEDIAARMSGRTEEINGLLHEAFNRQIINQETKDGSIYYSASNFGSRLDNFCMFGNYTVIPRKVRKKLDEWCFEEYLKRNDYFKKVIDADPEYDNCHNEWVLLLDEVEALIDAAPVIRVLPCDCKMMADNCDYSREICLTLDPKRITDRTGGRDLTKEEAKQLVRKLDREGLMHTGGPPNWKEAGPSVVCNCCSCCCYPFRAAKQLGTKGKWPKARYVAELDREKCISCGLCAGRCHFAAFNVDKVDQTAGLKKAISFNADLCWGCGLCVNTCPVQAIRLVEIPGI